ncbi:MAG: hypothetical protein AAGD32_07735 [Planctomycetota bacterium]
MPFASGSISARRFVTTGDFPKMPDEELLAKLAEFRLQVSNVGLPDEVEAGFCGGRHLFDKTFDFGNNVYADAIHLGIRIDTNKVPGDIKKAYQTMEEDALASANPSGFISKAQKREAKQNAERRFDDELRAGTHRRSKMTPLLWDLPHGTLYGPTSNAIVEKTAELFRRALDVSLVPLSAGMLALRHLESSGKRRNYEDITPTRFVHGPEGESQAAEYPWIAKGPEAKDFLGNEFLVWLWHETLHGQRTVGETTVFFDKALDLDCVFGMTGRDGLRGDGPANMPEALDALRSGKVPRKAGLILERAGNTYNLTLNAETFAFGGLKLPDVEEADSPRVLFEERIALLRDFGEVVDGLFFDFLKVRTSSGWESNVDDIRAWILKASARAVPRAA